MRMDKLDEAIEHYEKISQEYERSKSLTEQFTQLAEWLKELKKYRAVFEKVGKILADNGYTMDDLDTIFGKVNGEVKADEDDEG